MADLEKLKQREQFLVSKVEALKLDTNSYVKKADYSFSEYVRKYNKYLSAQQELERVREDIRKTVLQQILDNLEQNHKDNLKSYKDLISRSDMDDRYVKLIITSSNMILDAVADLRIKTLGDTYSNKELEEYLESIKED